MIDLHPITSFDLPELAPYRTMRRHQEHRDQGIFVAEGEKVVRRLLNSGLQVVSLLLPEKWARDLAPMIRQRPESPKVFVAEKHLLETLTGYSMYQGVLAIGRVPAPLTLDAAWQAAPHPRLFVAVDGLANAENLGALARNCGAFGVHALLVSKSSSSPFLRRAVRSSMGVIFRLPAVEGLDLVPALKRLQEQGVRCLAAHPRKGSLRLSDTPLSGDCCLVFGSEGHGISPEVVAACDATVEIPMAPDVDSLNVASASAAFLHEAQRQRFRQ